MNLIHPENLHGVHADLSRLVMAAADLEGPDIAVVEGLRSVEEELEIIRAGGSALKDPLRCRHVTGHAVDLAICIGKKIRWDWPFFYPLADRMKSASKSLGIPIEWGGDWVSLKDGPHFQLPWAAYPASGGSPTGG